MAGVLSSPKVRIVLLAEAIVILSLVLLFTLGGKPSNEDIVRSKVRFFLDTLKTLDATDLAPVIDDHFTLVVGDVTEEHTRKSFITQSNRRLRGFTSFDIQPVGVAVTVRPDEQTALVLMDVRLNLVPKGPMTETHYGSFESSGEHLWRVQADLRKSDDRWVISSWQTKDPE